MALLSPDEIYISTDIEADGPVPGLHSMLSLGSAAYDSKRNLIGTFSANFETLEGAGTDLRTMAWWKTEPAAWKTCRQDLETPQAASQRYVQWLRGWSGKPIFVAYGAAFDFMYVYYYLIRFAGESPFGNTALDIKTLLMLAGGTNFSETNKERLPRSMFDDLPHTHVALEDALEHGALFFNLVARCPARTETLKI
jgi:hypothetical protein